MTTESVSPPRQTKRVALLAISVTSMGVALVWCFLAMRAVLDVGGTCVDGGPYVSAQPCPDGAWLVAVGIPLLLIAAFTGMFVAPTVGAPDLMLPMWFLLFGSLGANFLEYGLWSDPWVWGWIICGVVFELMALPALYPLLPIPGTSTWKPPAAGATGRGLWWWVYLGLGLVGAVLGYVTFRAAA
jgi:hypothetical protein